MNRPKINWFKKAFYLFLKGLVILADKLFYSEFKVIGKENFKLNRPTIVISNHPSTMMDPVTVAAQVNRYVHFLANAGMFQTRFTNWFFSTFFCIPVQRRTDQGKRKFDNKQSFNKSFQFLKDGGCMYIAAEGYSTPEHGLKPLKSGTARIALGAEDENDFKLGVQILPVGLYYTDAQKFRSKLVVHAGEPIQMSEWKEAYSTDSEKTVDELTEMLQEKTEALLLNIGKPEHDSFFRTIETLANAKKPLKLINQYKRSQRLADQTRTGLYEKLNQRVERLIEKLDQISFSSEYIFRRFSFSWWHLLLPLAIVGLLVNLLPVLLILILEKTLRLYKGYTSTLKVLGGIILFPLCYKANNWLLSSFWDAGYAWPLLWVLYGAVGIFSFHYFSSVSLAYQNWRWNAVLSKSELGKEIQAEADQILSELAPYI